MAATHVALLRGINVGRAKRVAMADLRALVEGLGGTDVRTLLNSGNVVFTAPAGAPAELADRIEEALEARLGVPSRVTVLTADALAEAVRANPLLDLAVDHSRLIVAFFRDAGDPAKLEPLLEQDWGSNALAIGPGVAYVWCAEGILASQLLDAVVRRIGDGVTTRNWATVWKLHVLASGPA